MTDTYPEGATLLIHIGKCGGRTLKKGLSNAQWHRDVHVVHVEQPLYRRDLRYIIMARGPIARLESAFRWRQKLLITESRQTERFPGEYDVLKKYDSLNSLAESLYSSDGLADESAIADIKKIHHIKENISFYLTDLLDRCQAEQILAVLMQESLNTDIERVFGYQNELHDHMNPSVEKESELTGLATTNLRKLFAEDFDAIERLHSWGKITDSVYRLATS